MSTIATDQLVQPLLNFEDLLRKINYQQQLHQRLRSLDPVLEVTPMAGVCRSAQGPGVQPSCGTEWRWTSRKAASGIDASPQQYQHQDTIYNNTQQYPTSPTNNKVFQPRDIYTQAQAGAAAHQTTQNQQDLLALFLAQQQHQHQYQQQELMATMMHSRPLNTNEAPSNFPTLSNNHPNLNNHCPQRRSLDRSVSEPAQNVVLSPGAGPGQQKLIIDCFQPYEDTLAASGQQKKFAAPSSPNANGTGGGYCSSSSGGDSSPPPSQVQGSSRYKTELCRPFEENGFCKYGDKCQFAHGQHELRSLSRHPKYKTELCRTFHTIGICAYGSRCHFIHNDEEKRGASGGGGSNDKQLSPCDGDSAGLDTWRQNGATSKSNDSQQGSVKKDGQQSSIPQRQSSRNRQSPCNSEPTLVIDHWSSSIAEEQSASRSGDNSCGNHQYNGSPKYPTATNMAWTEQTSLSPPNSPAASSTPQKAQKFNAYNWTGMAGGPQRQLSMPVYNSPPSPPDSLFDDSGMSTSFNSGSSPSAFATHSTFDISQPSSAGWFTPLKNL